MQGLNYIIIGSSSGIGEAMALEIKAAGGNVIGFARKQSEKLQAAGIKQVAFDVTSTDWQTYQTELPEVIHGLVYAPGTINLKPFHRFSVADFQTDFQVNVLGAVQALQLAMKGLKAANGASVVLFSTVAAKLGMGFHASIASSKGAIEGLAKSLAAEWASLKIRVNVLAPSLTDTPLAGSLLSTPEKREASDKRHPIGRVGTPNDLSKMGKFLLSNDSSWVTGQIIGVDGGMGSLK